MKSRMFVTALAASMLGLSGGTNSANADGTPPPSPAPKIILPNNVRVENKTLLVDVSKNVSLGAAPTLKPASLQGVISIRHDVLGGGRK